MLSPGNQMLSLSRSSSRRLSSLAGGGKATTPLFQQAAQVASPSSSSNALPPLLSSASIPYLGASLELRREALIRLDAVDANMAALNVDTTGGLGSAGVRFPRDISANTASTTASVGTSPSPIAPADAITAAYIARAQGGQPQNSAAYGPWRSMAKTLLLRPAPTAYDIANPGTFVLVGCG